MSSSEIVSIYFLNLLIITQVLSILSISTFAGNEYVTDKGENVSIICNTDDPVMWIRKSKNNTFIIQPNYNLILNNVTNADSGLYICLSRDAIVNVDSVKNNVTLKDINYHEHLRLNLIVRTPPGPVTKLEFKASTILGYLIWKFNKNNSGGYPVRSFTAEYRNVSQYGNETEWIRLDPINISPNVRQMEVYHLLPNSTYEFRIWANNQLGSGDIVITNVTTLPEVKEEDLIRLIQEDIDNFDTRIWIAAVSIFLGTLMILATGLCIVLSKEFNQTPALGTRKLSVVIVA